MPALWNRGLSRRGFTRSIGLAAVAAASRPTFADDGLAARRTEAVRRGMDWLRSLQGDDGGWRSTAYPQLGQGPAGTALALWAAATVHRSGIAPLDEEPWKSSVERAGRLFSAGLNRDGAPAAPDGTLDFPTYAAAMGLIAARRFPALLDEPTTRRLRGYLIAAQCAARRRIALNHPDHGGWDLFGGETVGITSGTNVSITRLVLQGLNDAAEAETEAVRAAARGWLARCYDSVDGPAAHGIAFSPDGPSLNNKALWTDAAKTRPRAYGSSTCDGLLAMQSAGEMDAAARRRFAAAVAWLVAQKELENVPGFADAPPELGWAEGLRFYFFGALAECLPVAPEAWAEERAESLTRLLVAEQRPDGSWKSDSSRMREDDPLVATAFALVALAEIERFVRRTKG